MQDTIVRLWRSADRYDGARGSVRTFVYAIARNVAADLRRRRASRPLDTRDEVTHDPAHEPHDQLVLGLEVRDALSALSDKHREALELGYDHDLSQSQIAERLDVPLGTVKTRTFHALRELKAELQRRGIDV